MPYQERFEDVFVANRWLKKPKAKGGAIYTAVDPESFLIGAAHFLPTWDTTDHFRFACEACKSVADVLAVRFCSHYDSEVKYALFFYLGCRKCGATGQRKIHLDRRANACIFQTTYDSHNLYLYWKNDEPRRIIRLRVDQNRADLADLRFPDLGKPNGHIRTWIVMVRKALALDSLGFMRLESRRLSRRRQLAECLA
jgi:hypothetical protein